MDEFTYFHYTSLITRDGLLAFDLKLLGHFLWNNTLAFFNKTFPRLLELNKHSLWFTTFEFFFFTEQEARRAAERAYEVAKVDERVKRTIATANKAANAARVAAVKAVQKQIHQYNSDGTSPSQLV